MSCVLPSVNTSSAFLQKDWWREVPHNDIKEGCVSWSLKRKKMWKWVWWLLSSICRVYPTFLFGDCAVGMLSVGSLTEAHFFIIVNTKQLPSVNATHPHFPHAQRAVMCVKTMVLACCGTCCHCTKAIHKHSWAFDLADVPYHTSHHTWLMLGSTVPHDKKEFSKKHPICCSNSVVITHF